MPAAADTEQQPQLSGMDASSSPATLLLQLHGPALATLQLEPQETEMIMRLPGVIVVPALSGELSTGDPLLPRALLQSDSRGAVIRLPWEYRLPVHYQRSATGLEVTFEKLFFEETGCQLAPGIRIREFRRGTLEGVIKAWAFLVNPDLAEVRPVQARRADMAQPDLETVSEMARSVRATAALNGGFFSPRDRIPLGLLFIDGELIAGPLYRRSAINLTAGQINIDRPQVLPWIQLPGGESAEVDLMNLPPQEGSLGLYTTTWGARTGTVARQSSYEVAVADNGTVLGVGVADLGIPYGGYVLSASGSRGRWLASRLKRGDRLKIHHGIDEFWEGSTQALGGGPLLVRDGVVQVAQDERFRPDVMLGKAARTAIGIASDGTIILLGVAGPLRGYSSGISLIDLAAWLVELGAQAALNLDGGSSTTIWAAGAILNRPANQWERPVASALAIIPHQRALAPPQARLDNQ
ncbi:MAG: phosphodiester glycosidase family protein [Cyanobacteria bacterium NC_groundwater_1444_Ag_S-0.65um_54_12]|nr:phosphodiester glycosidase family protein [Cyanobacteria bacterium NC_groundwater_1444_Ag_S-0.65um_54_12]